jgi:Fasciclin domain
MAMTAIAGSAPHLRRPFRLLTVIWGDRFIDLFLNVTLPSLFSPENLPRFTAEWDARYAIYTSERDAERIRSSLAFSRLSALLPVDISTVSDSEMAQDKYELHWLLWNRGHREAAAADAVLIVLIPDNIYADGTLVRWGGYFDQGYKAVYMPGSWVVEETFRKELPAGAAVLSIGRQQLVDMVGRHIHPMMSYVFSNSGRYHHHPDRVIEAIPGEGFAARVFTSHPFAIIPGDLRLDSDLCPTNHLSRITFDQCSTASLAPLLQAVSWYYPRHDLGRERISEMAGWSYRYVKLANHRESAVDYRYQLTAKPNPENWHLAAEKLDRLRRQFLASTWIFRALQLMMAARCVTALHLLATVELALFLHEQVYVDGEITVLAPQDGAFNGWNWDAFFAPANRQQLVVSVLNHVIIGRPYLRQGELLALAPRQDSNSAPTEGFPTAAHGPFAIRRLTRPIDTAARVVEPRRRDRFLSLYVIDKVLRAPSSAAA